MEKNSIRQTDTKKETKNKEEKNFNRLVANRIKYVADENQWHQKQIIEQCKLFGYEPSQGDVSKLLNGDKTLDPYKLSILCKILNIDLEEVLSLDSKEIEISKRDVGFITAATDDKFSGFIGKYYGYFYSTDDKTTIHDGEFEFSVDPLSHRCKVSFKFKTGQKDSNNRWVRKVFSGTAKISNNLSAICCELTAEDGKGDLSYIIFKHMHTNYQDCMCRLGMVLTICAGDSRLPTAHRLLISRKKLTKKDYPFIEGQLKLNDKTFIVSEEKYIEFKQDPNLPDSIKSKIQGKDDILIEKATPKTFYSFREEDISGLELEESEKIISLLRTYSESKNSQKIGQKAEKITFKYIKGRKATNSKTKKPKE